MRHYAWLCLFCVKFYLYSQCGTWEVGLSAPAQKLQESRVLALSQLWVAELVLELVLQLMLNGCAGCQVLGLVLPWGGSSDVLCPSSGTLL